MVKKTENLVSEKDKLIEELNNRIKYLQSDFDNLMKYYDKEKEHIIKLSNKELIKNMLEILDDFDGALKNADEKELKGIVIIYDKLIKILKNNGLEPIVCVGGKFDPEKHEALIKEGNDEVVTAEFQKGYSLFGTVIRPSKVKIGGVLK